VTTPRERGAILLREMRSAGCTFTLGADGPRVRFSADCPSTPQLLEYIRENRQAVVQILREEQGLAPEPTAEPPTHATVAEPALPRTMVERDHLGQPLVIPPGGDTPVTYRRCTSFIDVLEDRQWLENWGQRQVAAGLMARPDLLASGVATDALCEEAKAAAGAYRKRDLGTALHALTERIDRGESPTIPEDFQPDIDAYLKATAHLKMLEIEVFVVNDTLQVGGTFDRVVEVNGEAYLADLKTGSLHQAQVAMQLALYASGERYDNGQRSPLNVDRERGLVIHLPSGAGTCTLYWVDLKAGWAGVELAARVWAWRDTPPEWLDEPAAPTPEPAAAVEPAVRGAAQGPAPEPGPTVAEKAVLIVGASKWPASKSGVILERLGRLPKGTKMLIHGPTETRNRRGPVGAAAIAKAAMALGTDVPVVTVAAGDLDVALAQVGYVLVFHQHLDPMTATAAVVEKARALGMPIEVIDGSNDGATPR
jgi:hypothetical protein